MRRQNRTFSVISILKGQNESIFDQKKWAMAIFFAVFEFLVLEEMVDQHFVVDLFFCMHESVRRKETALPLRPAVESP